MIKAQIARLLLYASKALSGSDPARVSLAVGRTVVCLCLEPKLSSLSFRAYSELLPSCTVLEWAVMRLQSVLDGKRPLVIICAAGEVEGVKQVIAAVAPRTTVLPLDGSHDPSAIDTMIETAECDTAIVTDLTGALIPGDVWWAIVREHDESGVPCTVPTGLPLSAPPVVVSKGVGRRLAEITRDPFSVQATVSQVAGACGWSRHTTPVPSSAQDTRRWPLVRIAIATKDDVVTLSELQRDSDVDFDRDGWNRWTATRVRTVHSSLGVPAELKAPSCSRDEDEIARVLFVSGPSGMGGDKVVLCLLAEALRRQFGQRVSMSAVTSFSGEFTERLRAVGVDVVAPECDIASPRLESWHRMCRILERTRPSVIHMNSSIGSAALCAIAGSGVPTLQHVHLAGDGVGELIDQLRLAKRVVAVSTFVRDRVMRYGIEPSKITVLRNAAVAHVVGHDEVVGAKEALAVDGRIVIACLGRAVRQKRHDLLVAAVSRLVDEVPQCIVLAAGDQAEDRDYARRLRELSLPLVRSGHWRWLPSMEPTVLFGAADVVVCPSEDEALPHVIVEARSFAIPVVAARSGGSIEAMGADVEGLFTPGDPEDFARVLRKRIAGGDRRSDPPVASSDDFGPVTAWAREFMKVYHELEDNIRQEPESAR